MAEVNVYRDGMVHVRNEQCDHCLFSKERLVAGSRARQIVDDTLRECGGSFVCHRNQVSDAPEAICRVWWDQFGARDPILRLAVATGIVTYVTENEARRHRGEHMAGLIIYTKDGFIEYGPEHTASIDNEGVLTIKHTAPHLITQEDVEEELEMARSPIDRARTQKQLGETTTITLYDDFFAPGYWDRVHIDRTPDEDGEE